MDETISLEDGWKSTFDSIQRVIGIIEGGMKENFPIAESSKAYTIVYKMCTQKNINHTEEMYKRYAESFRDYLVTNVLPAVRALDGVPMLQELVQRWNNQQHMMKYLSSIFFKYLDRYHVPRHNLATTKTVALQCFKKEVFDPVKERVRSALLEQIKAEREDDPVDHSLLKQVVQIFTDLGLNENPEPQEENSQAEITLACYQTDFEEKFLEESKEYYARKAALWVEEDSCPDYMSKAENHLNRERQRVKDYLHESTEAKLLEVCEKELLEVHQQKLLDKDTGLVALLSNRAEGDMSRMFRLFKVKSLKNGLQPIGDIMRGYITDQGNKVVDTSHEEESANMIERLLVEYTLFSGIVKGCFENHNIFQKALKEAFEAVVNRDVQVKGKTKTSAELMADFCDRTLKNMQKLGDEEITQTLDNAVQLFNHLQEKDYFADFYRIQLAKRLLMFSNLREDWENDMIQKLKVQCGSQFTGKMAGMVTDLTTSKEFQDNFEENNSDGKIVVAEAADPDTGKIPTIEVKVQVLTRGYWPSYASPDELTLPAELQKCMSVFTEYYTTKQTHRKLRWVHTMGKNTLEMRGVTIGKSSKKESSKPEKESKKKKGSSIQLVLSTIQALILLMFNEHAELSIEQMATALHVDVKELRKYLKSLALGKEKILRKTPDNKEISAKDVFHVNPDYSTSKNRVSIPLLVMQTDEKQVAEVHENVQQDRKLAIEAGIVRIMKARNHLSHQQLVLEVSSSLSSLFKPDGRVIKKRIEDLISRDYLERDEAGSGYNYKA